jgi:SAM-dependent methyltransferase
MTEQQLNPCSVCGQCDAERFSMFFEGQLTLWRCKRCGYVSPGIGRGNWQPPEQLAGEGAAAFVESAKDWRYPHRRRVLQDIARRVALRTGPAGRVLDVGCGDGQFLSLAREAGLTPVGIEGDEALAAQASQRSGCEVYGGRDGLETLREWPEASFQAVTFIHSLEHFPNPCDMLVEARRVLRPGGLLAVDLPSIRSPHWLAWRATGITRFVDNAWGIIDEHAGYYTPATLEYLTLRAGFRTLTLTTGRWRYKYHGLAQAVALLLDPLLNVLRVGGIFYLGEEGVRPERR